MSAEFYEDDVVSGKVLDRHIGGRLLSYVRPYSGLVAITIMLMIVTSALTLVGPLIVKYAIDEQLAQSRTDQLGLLALIFAGHLVVGFALRYAQDATMAYVGQRVIMDMRRQVFAHLQRMSIAFFDRNPVGRLVTRVTNDVATIEQAVSVGVVTIITNLLMVSAIIVVLLLLDLRLALLMYAFLPFLILAVRYFAGKQRDLYREQRLWLARINAYLNELITGMAVVQLFNRERESARRFDDRNERLLNSNLRFVFWYSVFEPTVVLFGAATTVAILAYGGSRVLDGSLSIGTLVAFTQYMAFFYWPLRELSQRYTTLQQAMASGERIFGLLDEPEELTDPPEPRSLPVPVRGEIEFRHVSFEYEPGNSVLRDVSFTVAPGEWLAIVGATGAGKSTIIALLSRFYDPTEGEILVDGVPIGELRQRELRRHVGVMLQEPFIYTDSIEENIRLRDPSIELQRAREAARQIGADSFIEQLPDGYQTMLAERGANLSTGQKQLIALARVAAFNPQIVLVMDEATASIDPETEALIQGGIREVMRDRSSIVIAHRLNTIRLVSRIIVLDHGSVVEEGTHEQLLALDGQYARFYELQYRGQGLPAAGSRSEI